MSRYRDRMGNDRKTKREIGRRLRRGSVMMCMMITSAMLLSACGGNSSQSTTAAQATEAAAESGAQDSQNEVMGRVKSVSDTEITVEQGPGGVPSGAPDGQPGQNNDGQQPGGAPDGKGQPPQGSTSDNKNQPSQGSTSDNQNQPPKGGAPEGNGQPPQGETTTYKITTSTTFTDADGASIQVSDIKEGDFVKITTDSNGTAVQISLADMPGGPDGPQGGPGNGAPAGTAGSEDFPAPDWLQDLSDQKDVPAPEVSLDAGGCGLLCRTAGRHHRYSGDQDHKLQRQRQLVAGW